MAAITKDTTLGEIVQNYPQVIPILLKYGLHCVGCPISSMESLEQGALGHGLTEERLKELLKELNDAIKKKA